MDTIDAAQDLNEIINTAALSRRKPESKLTPNGTCHNPSCNDDIADGRLFCNDACAREFERISKRNMR